MHLLLLGWPEGHLSLEASYGPVIWSSSLFVADHQENAHSLYRRPEILRDLPGLTRSAAPLSWRDCCETVGPEGVSWLLHQFRAAIWRANIHQRPAKAYIKSRYHVYGGRFYVRPAMRRSDA